MIFWSWRLLALLEHRGPAACGWLQREREEGKERTG